ncbi:hypothetical protein ASPSYDRAFT_87010 [Aspergillus sydowii CBS 593.65]|uniref:Uncharacterized protein n=1 Tax=Aspergillus sydowii CBS 593.65 TaxID=1036612 RepID=A0A1L9TLY0_9EURO|nr:uncharacterized protein ASPSYDRAFT_87010 [Aspergillus sydowii CBS 593.65]OJJ60425.1 hypothetical protein ASPSYDRAFT_87010 [Aspergillus sydowii CBS 593.65]
MGLVLRSYTGLEDVCFSSAASGREAPLKGIHNTIGTFPNAAVCRVRVPPIVKASKALVQARCDSVESLDHQYYTGLDDAESRNFARLKGKTLTELAGLGFGVRLVDAAERS